MGKIRVLNKNGDDETNWTDEVSTETARQIFNYLRREDYLAFGGDGQIRDFDANENEIIMVKRLVGG